jgi:prepilin-type N-terminal cleavage/methylation domain-containing protein
MRKDSGLTLIEVMVVIGIIAILAALAVPNFNNWIPKRRLSAASQDILSAMQYARSMALKDNASVGLLFDDVNDMYSVFVDNGAGANAGNAIQDGDEPTERSGQMPAGIDLVNTTLTDDKVFFDSRGLLNNAGGIVNLRNTLNETKAIEIIRTGNSRIL